MALTKSREIRWAFLLHVGFLVKLGSTVASRDSFFTDWDFRSDVEKWETF